MSGNFCIFRNFLYIFLVFLHSYGKLENFVVFNYKNICAQDLWILENEKYFDWIYIYWHICMRSVRKISVAETEMQEFRRRRNLNFLTKIFTWAQDKQRHLRYCEHKILLLVRYLNLILNFLFGFCYCLKK